jgi:hypothetical protein
MGTYVNPDQIESLRSVKSRDGNPLGPPEYELRMISGEMFYVEYGYREPFEKLLVE